MASADHAGSSLVLSRLQQSWKTVITGEWSCLWMLFTTCNRIPVLSRTQHWSACSSISASAAMSSLRVKVPLVLLKVASPPLNVLGTARPSSNRMPLNSEAASPSFSGKKVSCHCLLLFVVVSGNAHHIVEVRHDERRVFVLAYLKLPSERLCKAVQCFRTSGSTGLVFRLRRAAHHKRCDVVLSVSKSDGTRSSLQVRECVKCFYHISRLQHLLVREGGHSCSHVRGSGGWVYPHRTSKCRDMLCCLREVDDMCIALFANVTDSVCLAGSMYVVGHNQRANH